METPTITPEESKARIILGLYGYNARKALLDASASEMHFLRQSLMYAYKSINQTKQSKRDYYHRLSLTNLNKADFYNRVYKKINKYPKNKGL